MPASILVLVGSLRAESTNRKLAETFVETAAGTATASIYEHLADVPLYNEDIDRADGEPESARRLRAAIDAADALLIVTPEHNGTIPAALKNAIDWGSRPFGTSALSGKPTAVVGCAFGRYGGLWAHDEARKSLGIAGAEVLTDITLSIPGSLDRFTLTHPRDDSEVTEQLAGLKSDLLDALTERQAA